MSNKISKERKQLYYFGMGLMVLGFILFMSSFFITEQPSFGFGPPPFFVRAVIGMICLIIGSVVMSIGQRGAAGAGLILDPDKAREDLKPFNQATGKMINDVIENVDAAKGLLDKKSEGATKEIVKLRCRDCGALNDEDARYCKSCGKEL